MTKNDFDAFASEYDVLLRKETSFFSKNDKYFAEYKINLTLKLVNYQPEKILELGCGTGRNIQYLQKYFPGRIIHGSDISEDSLNIARKENPDIHFYVEDGSTAFNEFYDLIFVAGVFHHVKPCERKNLLYEIRRRLRKGGNLIIFEHNPYNPITKRIVNNCPYDADAVLLTSSELKQFLNESGFKIIDRGYTLFFPPAFTAFVKMERYLKWFPMGGQHYVHANI